MQLMKAYQSQQTQETLTCQKRPAPNARMDKQMRYHSTKRRKGSTKAGSLTKPSEETVRARERLGVVEVKLCSICLKEDDIAKTEEVEWIQCSVCGVWLHLLCAQNTSDPLFVTAVSHFSCTYNHQFVISVFLCIIQLLFSICSRVVLNWS